MSCLRTFNFVWNSGDFVQIEGHNGIGKTSLLRILIGLAQQRRRRGI
ncbi:cytochrome c biogenesis protein CcmA, partial [Pasteurella multocida subsp. multocida str. Anand1_cattle]